MATSNGCVDLAPRILCDGEIEIVRLTEEYYEQALEVFLTYFIHNENLCKITNLLDSKLALSEIEQLFRAIIKDNISFGAKHVSSGCLAGISINKILEPKSNCNLDEVFNTFKSREMVFIGSYLDQMEHTYDLYKELNVDCCMEVVFLSTRPEFAKKGIARSLTAYSIDFARQLGNGLLNDNDFPEHIRGKRPKAVCSVFTTKFTQLIGEKLGFNAVVRTPHTELVFDGHTFAEKIDPIHVYSVFAVKRL